MRRRFSESGSGTGAGGGGLARPLAVAEHLKPEGLLLRLPRHMTLETGLALGVGALGHPLPAKLEIAVGMTHQAVEIRPVNDVRYQGRARG